MISGSVTNRYADALFELSREKGELEAVTRDVEFLAAEVQVDSVANFLFDGRVDLDEKRKRLEFLEKHISKSTYNFVRLLTDKNRLEVLRGLGPAFRRRQLQEAGMVEGVLETARPLGEGEQGELEAALGQMLGKRVTLETRIVPELIGGVRVTVDHRMLDQSLRGRLEGLRTTLTAKRLTVDTTVGGDSAD